MRFLTGLRGRKGLGSLGNAIVADSGSIDAVFLVRCCNCCGLLLVLGGVGVIVVVRCGLSSSGDWRRLIGVGFGGLREGCNGGGMWLMV